MLLMDEMRGRAFLWVAESDGAGGGEGRWPTGGVGQMEVLIVEDEAGGGRTQGYLAVAVRLDIENNVIELTNGLVVRGM